jgi:hypothetical protein
MPFASINPLPEDTEDFEKIGAQALKLYRLSFENRHYRLFHEPEKLDFLKEISVIRSIRTEFLQKLVTDQNEVDHYLVALFVCDADLQNLSVNICIKKKKSGSETYDPIVSDTIHDLDWNKVPENQLKERVKNYKKRKEVIYDTGNEEYEKDALGRTHKITANLKKILGQFGDTTYIYFIVDELGLSVVYADHILKFDGITTIDDPDAYDHGGACCPI